MHDTLTPSQAAEYLRRSTATVYRLIHDEQLAATRVGRTYRISRRDLEAFLMAREDPDAGPQHVIRRFLAIAERNPDVDGDALLEELERDDARRRAGA